MAVKDGLGPRPVAQSAKHYFLSLVYSCFCILASNFLFRASFACYVCWDCPSFLASFFGLLTLHLASLSVPPSLAPHLHCTTLVACNLFSDALPLLSAGVGGFLQMQRLLLGRLCVRCTGRSLRLRGVRHGGGGAYVARPGGGIHLAVSLLAIRTGTTEQPELQPAPGHPLAPGISQVDAPMVC